MSFISYLNSSIKSKIVSLKTQDSTDLHEECGRITYDNEGNKKETSAKEAAEKIKKNQSAFSGSIRDFVNQKIKAK
jgi:hypothetical protein